MEYVYGFFTATNASRDENHQINIDNASIELWLRNCCTKNPTRRLLDAVDAFINETPGTPIK
jgi:hypothetical protein